jgi:pimeloyl-ACP methyl ester carboxylesterase
MSPLFGWMVFALAVVASVCCVWLFAAFRADRKQRLAYLGTFSRVIETRLGPVELAEVGSGQPVLVIHGGMGGADQTAVVVEVFSPAKQRFLCISRPGYLRTPLGSGASVAEQAKLFAAVLDVLQIESVPVLALSFGARYALRFAQLFPDRCSAIVLVGGLFQEWPELAQRKEPSAKVVYRVRYPNFIGWLIHRFALKRVLIVSGVSPQLWREASKDPIRLRLMETLFTGLPTLSMRLKGMKNDDLVAPEVAAMTLDGISQPLLLVHAENDAFAPVREARRISQTVPSATLYLTADGGHVSIATHYQELVRVIEEFLHRDQNNHP